MDDPLLAVRQQFRTRCADDLRSLRAAIRDPDAFVTPAFQRMVHRISGIAGSLGFPQLSTLAAEIERACRQGAAPDEELLLLFEESLSGTAAPSSVIAAG